MFKALLPVLFLSAARLFSQGCSDAGFCTLGEIHSSAEPMEATQFNRIAVGSSYGIGDDGNTIITPYFSYHCDFRSWLSLTSKITAAYIDGDLGRNFNVGDWYNAANFHLKTRREQRSLTLVAGLKIPLNNSDAHYEGAPLPLSYQTSLGTVDGILGISYGIRHFEGSAALQYPFTKTNENTFFAAASLAGEDKFKSTNSFHRQPDVLLKATYRYITPNHKWQLLAGLLPIYHLGEDSYKTPGGEAIRLKNSDGLTLNGLFNADYFFKANQYLELSLAAPFVVREIRPDGLTREFVAGLEYNFAF